MLKELSKIQINFFLYRFIKLNFEGAKILKIRHEMLDKRHETLDK